MKLTITKSEGAIIQKLIADRKSDIHNIGGDSKQAERLEDCKADKEILQNRLINNKYVIKHWSKLIYIYNNVLSLRR